MTESLILLTALKIIRAYKFPNVCLNDFQNSTKESVMAILKKRKQMRR